MDGFVNLVRDLPVENGMPEASAHCKKNVVLPGCFRPGKPWDLLVVLGGRLLATIEFKSQVGPSFGHNYNNRTEEALGSATDILAAYRERAFRPTARMHVSVGGNRTVNLPRQALRTALPGS